MSIEFPLRSCIYRFNGTTHEYAINGTTPSMYYLKSERERRPENTDRGEQAKALRQR
ncbi:hypothetical protein Hdeb2414_s0017g00503481 [Helianthus debilis subsp. tardiflorus]